MEPLLDRPSTGFAAAHVPALAEARDARHHDGAVTQEGAGRHADPTRRAGGDDIAGRGGVDDRRVGDESGGIEDEVRGVGFLLLLAVDLARDLTARPWRLVARDQPWPARRRSLPRLSRQPLAPRE